jgi:hypothetical protein
MLPCKAGPKLPKLGALQVFIPVAVLEFLQPLLPLAYRNARVPLHIDHAAERIGECCGLLIVSRSLAAASLVSI